MQAPRTKVDVRDIREIQGHDVVAQDGTWAAGSVAGTAPVSRGEPGNFRSRLLVGCFNWQIAYVSSALH